MKTSDHSISLEIRLAMRAFDLAKGCEREHDLRAALTYSRQGLELLHASEGIDAEPLAFAVWMLAETGVRAARQLEDLASADEICEQLVACAQRPGVNASLLASALNIRGMVRLEQGRYHLAEGDLRAAERLLARDGPASNLLRSVRHNIEVLVSLRVGRGYGGATKVASTFGHTFADDGPVLTGPPEEDMKLLSAWLARQTVTPQSRRALAIQYSNLGFLQRETGDPEAALETMGIAVSLLAQEESPGEPMATVLYNMSTIYWTRGDLERAAEHLSWAWNHIRGVALNTHRTLQILRALAEARLYQLDFDRCRAIVERAIEIYETSRSTFAADESGHLGPLQTFRELLALRLRVATHMQLAEDALASVERSKARIWLDFAARSTGREFIDRGEEIFLTIGPDGLAVDFFVGSSELYIVTCFNKSIAVRRVEIARGAVLAKVEEFHRALTSSSRRAGGGAAGMWLAETLFGALSEQFNGARHLVIMPDGPLWFIPFHALPIPHNWSTGGEGDPLGSIAPITVVPSATSYGVFTRRERATLKHKIVVVSNPATADAAPSLPGTEQEADEIQRVLTGDVELRRLHGAEATPENLWESTRDCSIVHLGAHGEGHPRSGDAWLMLSDSRRAVKLDERAILAGYTGGDLVFLSACSTAVGQESEGEGLMSVARAFLFAGARCVVASMWPVDDADVPALIARFYRAVLAGESYASAMRQASLSARSAGAPARVWAAFQVFGDGHASSARLDYRGTSREAAEA